MEKDNQTYQSLDKQDFKNVNFICESSYSATCISSGKGKNLIANRD